jgi:hypothetical protein
MALISVSGFSKNEFISDKRKITVEFDGYLNVNQVIPNIVTKRPVEAGFDLYDAVHNNPITLTVEIIITDTEQSVNDKRAISNRPYILGTKFVQTHTKKQLNRLKEISDKRETISFKTKYSTYKGYFLENFGYTETDEEGLRINFTLSEKRTNEVQDATSNIDDSIGLWS